MTTRISRPMDYAGRFGRQQADQAIKKDLIRALVELIKNSDDSYRRLENRGVSPDGRVLVEVCRRRQGSFVRVIDYGEGMDGLSLDRALGVYAEETSGFTEGEPVRGYFGRGIKDAILGLGEGTVVGIVNDQEHRAWLGIRDGRAHYEAREPVDLGADPGLNSTSVEVTVTRDDIAIPQWQNLRTRLLLHFALRDILSNDSRAVVVRTLDANGNPTQESTLNYQFPRAQLLHETAKPVPNVDASCRIVVYRAADPLDTPREQGYNAQAGFLIKSENAILEFLVTRGFRVGTGE